MEIVDIRFRLRGDNCEIVAYFFDHFPLDDEKASILPLSHIDQRIVRPWANDPLSRNSLLAAQYALRCAETKHGSLIHSSPFEAIACAEHANKALTLRMQRLDWSAAQKNVFNRTLRKVTFVMRRGKKVFQGLLGTIESSPR